MNLGRNVAYFTHRFEGPVALHPVGRYHYTVVYLDPDLHDTLPLKEHPRLRIEADISGIAVKGAWQPSGGRWFLMLPKVPLRQAGIGVGSTVEVAFKVLRQDAVDVPPELETVLQVDAAARSAWMNLSAGKQRGLAHLVASASRPETRQARTLQVVAVLLGKAPLPWLRKAGASAKKPTPST